MSGRAREGNFIASMGTSVPVTRSVDQIRLLVERFGAAAFGLEYDKYGRPEAVSFRLRDTSGLEPGEPPRFIPVQLRAPSETIFRTLRGRAHRMPSSSGLALMRAQAERIAWRNLHDFVRASLIAVQTGIMTLGEAFMASLVVTLPHGKTERLGELMARGGVVQPGEPGQLLLGAGAP